MAENTFTSLSFVPLPLHASAPNQNQYSKFDDLYGKPPDEKDCPSSQLPPASQADRDIKDVLQSTKVRAVIMCGECIKPWCVYS